MSVLLATSVAFADAGGNKKWISVIESYILYMYCYYRRAALISIDTNIFNLPFAVVVFLTVVTVVSSEAIKIKYNLMWYQRPR